MTAKTESERLVAVETKLDYVIKQIDEQTKKLDLLLPTFVTREELENHIKQVSLKINEIKSKRWMQNTLSAVFGSLLTFLLIYVLTDIIVRR